MLTSMHDSQARRSPRRGIVTNDSAADSTSTHPVCPRSTAILVGELKTALRECSAEQKGGESKQPLYHFVLKQNKVEGKGWIQ